MQLTLEQQYIPFVVLMEKAPDPNVINPRYVSESQWRHRNFKAIWLFVKHLVWANNK